MRLFQKIALFLFFFSINFEVWDPFQTGGSLSISKLTGFLYFIMIFPSLNSFLTRNEAKPVLRVIWIFFGLLTLVNMFNVNILFNNFIEFTILQNIILFWILLNHGTYESQLLEKGMLSFAIGSVFLAGFFYFGIGIGFGEDGSVKIFGDNQNTIGLRMCISIFVLLLAVIQNNLHLGKIRLLFILPIPIMLLLMAQSGSRVSTVSFMLSFILGILLLKTRSRYLKIIVIAFALIVFIIIWKFLMNTELLRERLILTIQERNLSGRDIIWRQIIPLIKSSPFFGVGNIGYNSYAHNVFGYVRSPHNVILEVLCYTGIVGLVLYSSFLLLIWKKSLQIYRIEKTLLPILLLVPIIGMLATGQLLNVKIGWVIFAYIEAYTLGPKPQDQQR
jgi:O-antigen ligase